MSLRLNTQCAAGDLATRDRYGGPFRSSLFPSKLFAISPNPAAPSRRKWTIQNALPDVAASLYNGLGVNTQENLIKLHDSVLQRASELGLFLPSQDATSWWWVIVAPMTLSYLFATPGCLAGLADYVYGPIHARSFRSFSAEDVEIGRQLGEGSFGVVYEGFFGRGKKESKSEGLHVVLKKAKTRVKGASQIHNSEIHMNYRLQRTACFACAEFLGTMQVKPAHAQGKLSEGVWLVWNFQGDHSLDYYLKQKHFPENLIPMILGKSVQASSKAEIFSSNAAVIKAISKQILENLQDLHRTGVVHRDVKPLNLILDQNSGKFKFIDFGACVDLRSGFNYVPNETVIDPTYAAPERYVMPTTTPNLPPDPLCSLVSPLFWRLNTPDRFDLYSAGLILMQLSMKSLRYDTGMQAFNTELKRNGYNLKKWRGSCHHGKEEFAFLDADGGAGWELVAALLQPRHDKDQIIWPSLGSSRPSASAALRHRFFHDSFSLYKIFPKVLADPALHLIPAFEGVAQSLSSAAKKVVNPIHLDMNGPTVEHHKDEKMKTKAPSFFSMPSIPFVSNAVSMNKQYIGMKELKVKGAEHSVGTSRLPNLSLASLADLQLLLSTSRVREKLSHALQDAFNGGLGKVDRKGVDASNRSNSTFELTGSAKQQESNPTFGGLVSASDLQMRPPSSGVRQHSSHALQGAFNGGIAKVDGKEVDASNIARQTSEDKVNPKQQEHNPTFGVAMRSGAVFSPVGTALPTITTSAAALATGWLVLSGLNSSAQASYEFGKLLMSSSGISGSAFLAFFLVIKPWLEEHNLSLGKTEEIKVSTVKESQENIQIDKYKSIHSEYIKVEVVVEAMQELDLQMSVLESLMLKEQQVSQRQKELVQRLESLLLQPPSNKSL